MPLNHAPIVAVLGAGECGPRHRDLARDVGRRLARAGYVVATGGLGGVMEAASEGARGAGGRVLGILPGPSVCEANAFVDIPVATGMGDARNAVLANTAGAFIAIAGSYGTLSEIAFALKRGKPVVSLDSFVPAPAVRVATTAEEAVAHVLTLLPPR